MTAADTTIDLRGRLEQVHRARTALATITATIRAQREAFEASIAELVEIQKVQQQTVAEAEVAAKAAATYVYAEKHEKKPHDGVEIKLFSTMEYDDAQALAWARETKLCLVPESLDRKAFEKVAKATELPFVRQGEEVRVQLASDLSKVFPRSDEAPF